MSTLNPCACGGRALFLISVWFCLVLSVSGGSIICGSVGTGALSSIQLTATGGPPNQHITVLGNVASGTLGAITFNAPQIGVAAFSVLFSLTLTGNLTVSTGTLFLSGSLTLAGGSLALTALSVGGDIFSQSGANSIDTTKYVRAHSAAQLVHSS